MAADTTAAAIMLVATAITLVVITAAGTMERAIITAVITATVTTSTTGMAISTGTAASIGAAMAGAGGITYGIGSCWSAVPGGGIWVCY
jgi:hypothetical protein